MRTGRKKSKTKRTKKRLKRSRKASTKDVNFVVQKKNTPFSFSILLTYIGKPFTKVLLFILKRIANQQRSKNKKIFNLQKIKAKRKQLHKALKSLKKQHVKYTLVYHSKVSRISLLNKRLKPLQKWILNQYQQLQNIKSILKKTSTFKKGIALEISEQYQTLSAIIKVFVNRVATTSYSYFILQPLQRIKTLVKTIQQKRIHLLKTLKIKTKTPPFIKKLKSILFLSITFKLRYALSLSILIGSIAGARYFYVSILTNLPDPSTLGSLRPSLTTKIYDRNKILLYKIFKNENRSLTPLKDIPPQVIQATIAIEDQNFYQHPGFSIRGISRAVKANLTDDTIQGGSTITQQLIKNTLLTPEQTFERKIKELILSFTTEFYYSKDEILAMYLNQVAYGGFTYGVEEASQMYFGKSIKDVSLAEASFLAGLPAAPTKYSPYGAHPEHAKSRQKQVLRRMVEDGYVTAEEADKALKQELSIIPPKATILAPHFVMYVREVLAELYGSQLVEQGGLEITTSLDLALHNHAQKMVAEEVAGLSSLNVSNGAALVTNPQTGEVLAMVGSINYFDSLNDGQVNITVRERQPGSSIKPLTYAMGLERGLTPASIVPDTPVCYKSKGQPDYCPKNYDDRFHGNVTIRQALANSYNIPAVKTLAQFSVNDLIDKAEAMGITTWKDRNRFGLALTLGGGEIKMTDMAVAYGVFANNGMKVPLRPILEVKDAEGKILDTNPCIVKGKDDCEPTRALDPRVAYQITDILSDNKARSQAFGLNSVLHIPGQQVAVKTGTTNSLRDNWTFGYTKDRVVAAWVGNNDNSTMNAVASGITGASPIWAKLVTAQLSSEEPHVFQPPTNLAKVQVCTITGQLACNGCPSRDEYFIPGTEPKNHCTTEAIARILNPTPPETGN